MSVYGQDRLLVLDANIRIAGAPGLGTGRSGVIGGRRAWLWFTQHQHTYRVFIRWPPQVQVGYTGLLDRLLGWHSGRY